jgi:hypothetical protein
VRNTLMNSFVGITVATVLLTASSARADQRNFTIMNDSANAITNLYVSSVATQDWEEDILGVGILEPDASTGITFSNGVSGRCLYDIKVISNGTEHISNSIDLCSTSSVIFSGGQLVVR